jgi:hypothetical protein
MKMATEYVGFASSLFRRLTLLIIFLFTCAISEGQSEIQDLSAGLSSSNWSHLGEIKELIDNETQGIRIVFYGQSLINRNNRWATDYLPNALKNTFGDLFIVINKTRGGWASSALAAVTPEDIEPTDPDLVIIHDYPRGNGSLEALLAVGFSENSPYTEWYDEYSFSTFPEWAAAYNLGYIYIRTPWGEYLKTSYGDTSERSRRMLLADNVHLNEKGQRLWAHIVLRYFGISFPIE